MGFLTPGPLQLGLCSVRKQPWLGLQIDVLGVFSFAIPSLSLAIGHR
jgi:hypothetical protein